MIQTLVATRHMVTMQMKKAIKNAMHTFFRVKITPFIDRQKLMSTYNFIGPSWATLILQMLANML